MRILMLGNSLTTANGMPGMLAELLGAEVVVHARGGARLAEHLNPQTRLGASTQRALVEESWDFVVMQEMSNGPVRFPQRFAESVGRLCEMARAAGAQPVLYATWAHAEGSTKLAALGLSHEEMAALMRETCQAAAERGDALLADVGEEFQRRGSGAGLVAGDGVHPTPEGSRVACEVIARTIGCAPGCG